MKLTNKIAMVSASTKGIGLACALKLAQEGAIVYLAARNKTLANEIIQKHQDLKIKYVYFDVGDENSMISCIDEIIKNEGRIDILVNNFGTSDVTTDKTIFDTNYADFIKVYDSNLKSVFLPSQQAIKYMTKQKSGSIINISTIGSIVPDFSRIGYVTLKAAINSLTKNIAGQVAAFNIRCNAVLPGLTNTDAVKNNLPKEFVKVFLSVTPMKRIGEPDDIANAVLFLASDESSYITGHIMPVAGYFGEVSPLYPFLGKK